MLGMTKFGTISQGGFWLNGWEYGKKITVPKSKVDADLTNFPLTVYLNEDNFDFTKAETDGKDIRFTDKNKNHLTFERKEHVGDSGDSSYSEQLGIREHMRWSTWPPNMGVSLSGTELKMNGANSGARLGHYWLVIPIKKSDITSSKYNKLLIDFSCSFGAIAEVSKILLVDGYYDYTSATDFPNDGVKLPKNSGISKELFKARNKARSIDSFDLDVTGMTGEYVTLFIGSEDGNGYNWQMSIHSLKFTDSLGAVKFEFDYSVITPKVAGTYNDTWEISVAPASAVYNVLVPTVSNTEDTEIYMWYGNASATDTANTTGDVWDDNYVMVQHMGDSLVDATGKGNNGTNVGTTVVDTEFGKARSFNGNTVKFTDSSLLYGVSALIYFPTTIIPNSAIKQGLMIPFNNSASYIYLGDTTGAHPNEVIGVYGGSGTPGALYTGTIQSGWRAFHYAWNGSRYEIYIDGEKLAVIESSVGLTAGGITLGVGGGDYFIGKFAAFRRSNSIRSAAWIKAESLALKNELLTQADL